MSELLLGAAAIFGLGGVGIPLAILGWQTLTWLKAGDWPPLLVLDTFRYFQVEPSFTQWLGVNKLIVDVLQSSLGMSIFIAGMAVATVCAVCGEKMQRSEWERRRRLRARNKGKNAA